jgi:hypothetical protein
MSAPSKANIVKPDNPELERTNQSPGTKS